MTHPLYRCGVCDSTDVQVQAWVNPNTNGIVNYVSEDWTNTDVCWCSDCQGHTQVLTIPMREHLAKAIGELLECPTLIYEDAFRARLVDVTITKSGRVLIRGTYGQRLLVIGQIERTTVKWSSLWKTDEGPELSPLALEMIAGRVADVMTLFRTCRFDPKWLDDHTLCLKGG